VIPPAAPRPQRAWPRWPAPPADSPASSKPEETPHTSRPFADLQALRLLRLLFSLPSPIPLLPPLVCSYPSFHLFRPRLGDLLFLQLRAARWTEWRASARLSRASLLWLLSITSSSTFVRRCWSAGRLEAGCRIPGQALVELCRGSPGPSAGRSSPLPVYPVHHGGCAAVTPDSVVSL